VPVVVLVCRHLTRQGSGPSAAARGVRSFDMTYASSQNAVCFEDLKTAALYFDSVIPISFSSMHGRGEGSDVFFKLPEDVPGEVLVHLLFGVSPASSPEKWAYLGKYIDSWDAFIKAIQPARKRFSNSYDDVKDIYLNDASLENQSSVRGEFRKLAKALGKSYTTVILPSEDSAPETTPYAALGLSGVPLVDASRASWEQIMELRKDPEARTKLRNLRLFFHTNYQGKPTSFIVDDLGRRLDDYSAARKRLGFEFTSGCISSLLDARILQAAAATSIAAAFVGGPIASLGAAVFVEIGGVALEFSRKRYAIREFEKTHDLAYLIEARASIENKF